MIVLPYFLNLCYFGLVVLALPVVAWKRIRSGKYRLGWRQKLWGCLPERKQRPGPRLWLHAVSVGEVLQLQQIVAQLKKERPDAQILITTTTETGYRVAREKFPDCDVSFFPLDFSWSVNEALRRVRPDLIVLVELELWPNFILAASRRCIPLVLVNGRLSEKSFNGYRHIRPLVKRLLGCFRLIAVQADEYRERFLELGAESGQMIVTGSIKFDGVVMNRDNDRTRRLADWMNLQPGQPVLIAGSTQHPEEQMALEIYGTLRKEYPALRLIIVPRHPERGHDVASLITSRGFPVQQRTRPLPDRQAPTDCVGLLDTVGELGACWGLAEVAFVGGSFTDRGGQNMLEPAAYGAAVCFGPNTWNFRQVVDLLLARQAARQVHTKTDLEDYIRLMLAQPMQARAQGERARTLILEQQGATQQTVQLILWTLCPSQILRRSAA
jgi:3-deoxy-D-manno-octulosonic-acid transferase